MVLVIVYIYVYFASPMTILEAKVFLSDPRILEFYSTFKFTFKQISLITVTQAADHHLIGTHFQESAIS